MSNIRISNLSFSYGGSHEKIFDNVSLNLDSSWKLGLIGRNGRGKTTLLNLFMNKYEYQGSIVSKIDFAYFPYNIENEDLNVIDIVGDDWRIYKELSLLEVEDNILYRPYNTLSNGEKTKVQLAYLFTKENNFLLIDEPTNHLDFKGRELLSKYLRKKQGFILVSHDRYFIDNSVDHIMSINKTNIDVVAGNFSSWNSDKEKQDTYELEKNIKLKNEIKRLSEAAKEKAIWSDRVEASKSKRINPEAFDKGYIGHQAAKMMKRSKSIERRVDNQIKEKAGLLKNIEVAEDLKIESLNFHSKLLIKAENISISYNDNNVVKDISFEVIQGKKINIKGKNGSGKTSLIKLILGNDIGYDGILFKAHGLIISYISQDTSFLKGKLSEFEKRENLDIPLFRAILRKLDFSRDSFEKPMDKYSEGQKKKVLIAKSLSEKAHIYIWDEPLNYIDVLSRLQIEKVLHENKLTLLFVEHDKLFCDNIADEVIEL